MNNSSENTPEMIQPTTAAPNSAPESAQTAVAPATTPFIDPKLISAIIMVESSDEQHPNGNDNAEGDMGLANHAYGCMQIRQGVCDDVNNHFGTHYTSEQCLGNRNLSIQLFCQYYIVHNTLITDEDRAKGWNGGSGWKKLYGKPGYERYTKNLDDYWTKIQKYL